MNNPITTRNGKPIVFVSSHPGFAEAAHVFMEEESVSTKVLDLADKHLADHPTAECVYLEVLGCYDDFKICKVLSQIDMLVIARAGIALASITKLKTSDDHVVVIKKLDMLRLKGR